MLYGVKGWGCGSGSKRSTGLSWGKLLKVCKMGPGQHEGGRETIDGKSHRIKDLRVLSAEEVRIVVPSGDLLTYR